MNIKSLKPTPKSCAPELPLHRFGAAWFCHYRCEQSSASLAGRESPTRKG
jgi:hypothetical protein